MSTAEPAKPQLLHLVFGGELISLEGTTFRDPTKIDVVGIFPSFASAQVAWRGAAQASVDNAMVRYFIVHLHRYLDPDSAKPQVLAGSP